MTPPPAARAVFRLAVFAATVAVAGALVQRAARPLWPEASGPSVKERIDLAFAAVRARRDDCIIVGNSRVYRGINPERLGVNAYNFAQDDDAFNQVFYKLDYLQRHGVRVRTLVMGVDYFQFSFLSDRRNFAYARHFTPAYLDDFPRPPGAGAARLLWAALHPIDETAFNAFMMQHFTRPASLLLEHGLSRLRGEGPAPPVRAFVRETGQFVIEGPRAIVVPIERDARRLPIQERYFEASLEWARRHGVRVLLVMPPLRRLEREGYARGVIAEFDRWLESRARAYGARYLNFAEHPGFTDEDFADITHLTPTAADRFSEMLGDQMRREMQLESGHRDERW